MQFGKPLLYLLVFISGSAGLMYQVAWHRYLAILLGGEARATATILGVFLGGLSLGYFLFGRWSRRFPGDVLKAYCIVELGLAVWALLFPFLFEGVFALLPMLSKWAFFNTFPSDFLVATILLIVPTTLMGGTLPLLTQGLGDTLLDSSETHAKLYGFNTVGACAGSILAGYWLLPSLPIPAVVSFAGALNALVAAVAWFGYARPGALGAATVTATPKKTKTKTSAPIAAPIDAAGWALLGVAFLSGFATISLESVLMRLVGLSAGSSAYHFTLIVSVFVLALGLGSLWLRRAERYGTIDLLRNQGLAFVALTALYFAADRWPYWVHRVRILFRDESETFPYYQLALGSGAFLVLFIPIAICGLTLPLCFHLLRDDKRTLGFRVGQLYAINTLGCVFGAVVGGYALLHWIDLDAVFRVCIACYAVGFLIAAAFRFYRKETTLGNLRVYAGIAAVALVIGSLLPNFHRERYVQPFRQQAPLEESYKGLNAWTKRILGASQFLWSKDGPNTSVLVGQTMYEGTERSRTLLVNGKSDGNTRGDFLTMSLTGLYPGLFAPKLDRACVIGFGTGITVGGLLGFSENKHVDVVDIASTVLQAAPFFDAYNGAVSKDPRVHMHATDAFRFLRRATEKYDVIVSEPSNPWVTGVENLYTAEYYDVVKEKLAEDGIFVQWVQAYSFRDDLLQMVFRTMSSRFANVTAFQMLEHDIALVATRNPDRSKWVERARGRFAESARARAWLALSGINDITTLLALEIVPPAAVPRIAGDAAVHKLLSPKLSHEAAVAFYSSSSARPATLRRQFKEFYAAIPDMLLPQANKGAMPTKEQLTGLRAAFCEDGAARSRHLCAESLAATLWNQPDIPLQSIYGNAIADADVSTMRRFRESVDKRRSFDGRDLQDVQAMFSTWKRFRSPIYPVSVEPMVERVERCMATTGQHTELRGDCLLELAAILEVAEAQSPRFATTLNRYERWFADQPATMPGYERFRRANDIMARLRNVASQTTTK